MYASFFGLRGLPFNNTPDPRFFYSTPDHEEALASLIYAIKERKGFVLLTGEVGAGKTLVSRMALRHFGTHIAFANINHAVQDPADLMESLCTEFDLDVPRGASNTRFVHILQDYLLTQFAHNTPVALVLDEAQNLSVSAFEQLRMIGNLEADDANLLQVVIVGQPELQQTFASHELRQLRQRIFRSFHLPALNREATGAYIRHRLAVAGACDRDIFDKRAVDRVYKVSQGLPRLINTICDNAMLSAYSADRRTIDGPFVDSVAEQMMIADGSHETKRNLEDRGVERQTHQVATYAVAPIPAQPVLLNPCYGTDQSAAALAALSNRVAALEARVQKALMDHDTLRRPPEHTPSREAVDVSNRELSRFERQVRARADEATRLMHDGIDRAAAKTSRVEHNAQATLDRLIIQTQQSQQLADTMARIIDRITPVSGTGTAQVRVTKGPSTAMTDVISPTSSGESGVTDRSRLLGMLTSTRESLSDLRAFVREPPFVPVTKSGREVAEPSSSHGT